MERKYNFFYWGPLLFYTKIHSTDLKKCAKLCSKKASSVSETLAGVIKHEHYISPQSYVKIIDPYFSLFRHAYERWYGKTLIQKINIESAWVNFMVAGEFNPPHMHTNCDFSSVLFVKIPEALKEEHKKFKGNGGGPGSVAFTYGEDRAYTPNSQYFFPQEGDLFIFPATLTHFVAPFLSKGERISMSANFTVGD